MTPAQIIEAIQGVRLEWGMTCPCTCSDCDLLYQRLSDIEDAIEASTSETGGKLVVSPTVKRIAEEVGYTDLIENKLIPETEVVK